MTIGARTTQRARRRGWSAAARRLLCLMAMAAMCALMSARPALAQDRFYEAYTDGVRAFKSGDLAGARALFERALELDSRQSRNKLFYGRRYEEYLPEYYLALISIREKQLDRARAYQESLQRAGLVKPGDAYHKTLTAQLSAAATPPPAPPPAKPAGPTTAEPRPADPRPPAADPGAGNKPSTPAPEEKPAPPPAKEPERPAPAPPAAPPTPPTADPPSTAKPGSAADWRRISDQIDQLLAGGEFERAWAEARRASALPGGAGQGAGLGRRVRDRVVATAEAQLRDRQLTRASQTVSVLDRIAPGSAEAARLRQQIEDGRVLAGVEREALKNLLMGNYQTVVEMTRRLIDSRRASGRVLFYAACSRAGLSLVAPADGRQELQAEARQLFAEATRSGPAFAKEETYVSPEILALLRRQ